MPEIFYRFGVALAIGLLIGIERQFRKSDESAQYQFGGVRTFPLLALAGCASAMLADVTGSDWGLAVPVLLIGALLTVAYAGTVKGGAFGMTTEVAAVLTLVIGRPLLSQPHHIGDGSRRRDVCTPVNEGPVARNDRQDDQPRDSKSRQVWSHDGDHAAGAPGYATRRTAIRHAYAQECLADGCARGRDRFSSATSSRRFSATAKRSCSPVSWAVLSAARRSR